MISLKTKFALCSLIIALFSDAFDRYYLTLCVSNCAVAESEPNGQSVYHNYLHRRGLYSRLCNNVCSKGGGGLQQGKARLGH